MPRTAKETSTTTAPVITPFSSDADFLTCAFNWLRTRVMRLAAKQNLADMNKPGMEPTRHSVVGRPPKRAASVIAGQRLEDAIRAESEAQAIYRSRTEEHRTNPNSTFTLGIDTLTSEAGLNEASQLVLFALAAPSIGVQLGEDILGGGRYFSGTCTIEQLITLILDNPDDIDARINARKIFMPSGTLLRHNLITVEVGNRFLHPEEVPQAYVRLTAKAFATLTGHPELADEGSTSAEDAGKMGA